MSYPVTQSPSHPVTRIHRLACFTAVATLLLIIAGGLVTSTGSGLAVPDWPLSYGRFFPPMVGGILYEHGHRMIAGTVAVLTALLAVWLWRAPALGRRRWLGSIAVGAVLAQALLGGATVLLRLPPAVSVAHACLGQTFFCVMVGIALVTSSAWARAVPRCNEEGARVRRPAFLTTSFLTLQVLTGAVVRHTGSGVSVHVVLALAVAAHVLLLGRRIMARHQDQPLLRRPMVWLGTLLVLQLFLGVGALLATPGANAALPPTASAVLLRTAHVAVGAVLLAASFVIALGACRLFPPARAAAAIRTPAEVAP